MNDFELNLRPRLAKKAVFLAAIAAMIVLSCNTSFAQLNNGSLAVTSVKADQMVRIFAGSPLGNTEDIEFELNAIGAYTLNWENEMAGSSEISLLTASFSGVSSVIGGFDLYGGAGTKTVQTTYGTLTNIEDFNGDLVSADAAVDSAFDLVIQATGARLYTQDIATFAGPITDGKSGEILQSSNEINVYLDLGGNIADDPWVGFSFNRTITAVPEPSSMIILAGISGLTCFTRRRKSN